MIFKKYFLILFMILGVLISDNTNMDQENKKIKEPKNPKLAWKLSIVPGLGQVYNEEYLKGFLFFSSEVALLRNISIYSTDIAMRNSLAWMIIGIYIYNIIDAYVDAELSSFSNNQNKE